MKEKSKTVGIIGMGRFGSFWAEFLSKDFEVLGFSRTLSEHPFCTLRPLKEVCATHTVFLTVPMRSMPETLEKIAALIAPQTIVADTCSVKVLPARWMLEKLNSSTKILATHPMFGPESAKFSLKGLPIVLSPVRLDEGDFSFWKAFFANKALSVIEMSPEEHDREAAKTQALTHMVGRVLSRIGVRDSEIGTLWYQRLVSICRQVDKDSEELFSDMQRLNPFAEQVRKDFEAEWQKTSDELEARS